LSLEHTFYMKKILFAALIASLVISSVSAQLFYSNHPPEIKWKRLETQHLEIVFPEGLDSVAHHTANLMNFVYPSVTKTLINNPRKISFFLFNQSAESNGYVTPIGPMMAWYTTPMQDVSRLGADDWFQTLAVHEYRHVTQFEKMDQGATHAAKILAGAYGGAVMGLISHPLWFAEGDAVATETALTSGGRGRLPSFSAPMRALVLEGKPIDYDRVYLGSYRYNYPNHYTLGYYLTVYGRRNFGETFWAEVLDDIAPRSFNPYQMNRVLKRHTKLTLSRYHQAAFAELKDIWLEQEKGRAFSQTSPLTTIEKRSYTSYTNPLIMRDSSVFVIKSGMDYPTQFVLVKDGKEEKLFNRNPSGAVTVSGNVLAWSEFITDVRFLERSYSDIFTYNVVTGKLTRFTNKSKYFAPAVSPDRTKIATVEFTDMMHCSLKILDAHTGEVITNHDAAPGEFFRTPSWDADGASLVFQISYNGQNTFVRFTPSSGARDILYGPTPLAIFAPSFAGEYLMFCSPATGLDAIHAVNLQTGIEYVAAQTRFGAQNAVLMPGGKTICYEDYSSDGYTIVQSSFDPANWQALESATKKAEDYFLPLVAQEQGGDIFEKELPDSTFAITNYSPLKNIINVHSWLFLPENEGASFTLLSNDKLNQLAASAGVIYNDNENAFAEVIGLTYMKYFPVISLSAIHGLRTDQLKYTDMQGTDISTDYHWQENTVDLSLELPFNFSRAHYTRAISLKGSVQYKEVRNMDVSELTNGWYPDINGVIVPVRFELQAINIQTPSRRDMLPNWGQTLSIKTENAIGSMSDFGSSQISVVGKEYLPGLLPSHGMYLQAGYEWQQPENWMYRAPSYMLFTRGYEYQSSNDWAQARVGYKFPLLYPDVHLGGTFYFKRISMELFADYAKVFDSRFSVFDPNYGQDEFTSLGYEVTLDFHPFRWLVAPLNIGFRSYYTVETKKQGYEFMLMGMTL